jgi:phage gp16-like protein
MAYGTAKQRSTIAKKASAGKDLGKKGKSFKPMAENVAKSYMKKGMSKAKATAVGKATAAKTMWKKLTKKK